MTVAVGASFGPWMTINQYILVSWIVRGQIFNVETSRRGDVFDPVKYEVEFSADVESIDRFRSVQEQHNRV